MPKTSFSAVGAHIYREQQGHIQIGNMLGRKQRIADQIDKKAMSWSDRQQGGTYKKGEGCCVARQKGTACNVEANYSNKARPGGRQRLDIFMRK